MNTNVALKIQSKSSTPTITLAPAVISWEQPGRTGSCWGCQVALKGDWAAHPLGHPHLPYILQPTIQDFPLLIIKAVKITKDVQIPIWDEAYHVSVPALVSLSLVGGDKAQLDSHYKRMTIIFRWTHNAALNSQHSPKSVFSTLTPMIISELL